MIAPTTRAFVLLGLLVSVGCGGLEPERRGLLAECNFNDECAPGLLCAARQCRAECRTDRDCTNTWRCRSAGQQEKRVCYEPGHLSVGCVHNSDCDSPFVCGPTRECIYQCRTDYDCRIAYPYEMSARCRLPEYTCDAHPVFAAQDGGP